MSLRESTGVAYHRLFAATGGDVSPHRAALGVLSVLSAWLGGPAAAAEPARGTLEPASAPTCQARAGMCAEWQLRATAAGEAWAEVATEVPVVFGLLKTWHTEPAPGGQRTRFSWTAEAGKGYGLPLRTVVAPFAAVPYTLTLSPNLVVAKAPLAARGGGEDWAKERERLMRSEPRTDLSRSSALQAEDLGFMKKDAWAKIDKRDGRFEGPLAIDFEASPDRCYYLLMKLEGAWTPEARRGAKARFIGPDGLELPSFDHYYRDAAHFGMVCPKRGGWTRLLVLADHRADAPWAGALATGTWQAELWAKPSNPFAYDAGALRPLVASVTKGMRKVRALASGRLEELAPVEVGVKAMKCYAAVLTLGAGASWSDATRRSSNVTFELDLAGLDVSGGPGVRGPGAAGDLGCHLAARPGLLEVRATGSKPGEPLGSGPFTLELYEGPYAGPELDEEKRDLAAERRTVKDVVEEAEGATCEWCARRRAACDDAGKKDCLPHFSACVSLAGYSPKRCGM